MMWVEREIYFMENFYLVPSIGEEMASCWRRVTQERRMAPSPITEAGSQVVVKSARAPGEPAWWVV